MVDDVNLFDEESFSSKNRREEAEGQGVYDADESILEQGNLVGMLPPPSSLHSQEDSMDTAGLVLEDRPTGVGRASLNCGSSTRMVGKLMSLDELQTLIASACPPAPATATIR